MSLLESKIGCILLRLVSCTSQCNFAIAMVSDPFDGITPFLLVAEHRSFTKAGRLLGISPAAVSQAVAKLEARLRSAAVSTYY